MTRPCCGANDWADCADDCFRRMFADGVRSETICRTAYSCNVTVQEVAEWTDQVAVPGVHSATVDNVRRAYAQHYGAIQARHLEALRMDPTHLEVCRRTAPEVAPGWDECTTLGCVRDFLEGRDKMLRKGWFIETIRRYAQHRREVERERRVEQQKHEAAMSVAATGACGYWSVRDAIGDVVQRFEEPPMGVAEMKRLLGNASTEPTTSTSGTLYEHAKDVLRDADLVVPSKNVAQLFGIFLSDATNGEYLGAVPPSAGEGAVRAGDSEYSSDPHEREKHKATLDIVKADPSMPYWQARAKVDQAWHHHESMWKQSATKPANSIRQQNIAYAQRIIDACPEWAYPLGWKLAVMAVCEWCNNCDTPGRMALVWCSGRGGELLIAAYHEARHRLTSASALLDITGREPTDVERMVCDAYERGRK